MNIRYLDNKLDKMAWFPFLNYRVSIFLVTAAFKCSNIHGISLALMPPSSTFSDIWAFLKLIRAFVCVCTCVSTD